MPDYCNYCLDKSGMFAKLAQLMAELIDDLILSKLLGNMHLWLLK